MTAHDIPAYMAHLGAAARASSTRMARADTREKNTALTELARQSDPEGAAQLALFAVESELGSAPTWLVNGRFKDEEDALRALDDALKRPAGDLKKAAGSAYGRLLGEPVPPVQRALR